MFSKKTPVARTYHERAVQGRLLKKGLDEIRHVYLYEWQGENCTYWYRKNKEEKEKKLKKNDQGGSNHIFHTVQGFRWQASHNPHQFSIASSNIAFSGLGRAAIVMRLDNPRTRNWIANELEVEEPEPSNGASSDDEGTGSINSEQEAESEDDENVNKDNMDVDQGDEDGHMADIVKRMPGIQCRRITRILTVFNRYLSAEAYLPPGGSVCSEKIG